MNLNLFKSLLILATIFGAGMAKAANSNLTISDVYVFREDNQTGNAADSKNVVFILNTASHSAAGQQVNFSSTGRYQIFMSRVTAANIALAPTGSNDFSLIFDFQAPDGDGHQVITITALLSGVPYSIATSDNQIITTTLAESKAGTPHINSASILGNPITVFAGMREDPFFFDIAQFLKVRSSINTSSELNFLPASTATDGYAKQNVNSIVIRAPFSMVESVNAEPIMDVWAATSDQNTN